MQSEVEYLGRLINIEIEEPIPGRYRWTYTIDGDHYTESDDSAHPNQGLVRTEAEVNARKKVEQLDAQA